VAVRAGLVAVQPDVQLQRRRRDAWQRGAFYNAVPRAATRRDVSQHLQHFRVRPLEVGRLLAEHFLEGCNTI
jgi:hypothetical protein